MICNESMEISRTPLHAGKHVVVLKNMAPPDPRPDTFDVFDNSGYLQPVGVTLALQHKNIELWLTEEEWQDLRQAVLNDGEDR